ncbi:MAG: tRNA (guanine(46)-N(7))-methyltransferase TrmB [Alphaproteobacteria bacterium]|nr:tRNA (guanine(46)-N(7))-methyltransferase TrmB [Alphaproteobacteria bacterium]MCL2889955.1 tRNA (guanine(46)-N(7))-methyltransferase TrmB [Alphaproteobacteria bacterium]
MENTEKSFIIRTFGRIHGKKLSPRQQWLVDNLLPTLSPARGVCDIPLQPMILEIGFGAGEHLMHLTQTNPDATVIGAEPFINGIASLLSHMTDDQNQVKPEYQNIRIWPDDVRKLLGANVRPFDKIYILHPDPWPKARHEKRRLLSAEFLTELTTHLAPDGEIIFGTDHVDLFKWTIEQIAKTNLKIKNSDFTIPPESGLDTRYKAKDMFGANHAQYLVLGIC